MSEKRKYLIGIDASFQDAGVCIYDTTSGKMGLFSGDLFAVMSHLNRCDVLDKAIAVIENADLDSTTFDAWFRFKQWVLKLISGKIRMEFGEDNLKSWFSREMKIAQDAGKAKAAGALFVEIFRRANVPVLEIAPSSRDRADKEALKSGFRGIKLLNMPTKTTARQFQDYTGHVGTSNEHSRDAGTLVSGNTIAWARMSIRVQEERRKIAAERAKREREMKKLKK